jgi:MFS family permease
VGGRSWRDLLSLPLIGIYIAFGAAQSVMGMLSALWSVWVRDLGGSYTFIGFTFTVFALPQIVLGAFAGRRGDRWGRVPVLFGAGLLIGIIYASYGLITNLVVITILGIVEGIALVFQQPVFQSLLAEASPAWARGRVQGIAAIAGAIGGGGAGLISFPLYHLSRPLPFLVAGAVVIVGSALAALSAAAVARRRVARSSVGAPLEDGQRATVHGQPPGVLS